MAKSITENIITATWNRRALLMIPSRSLHVATVPALRGSCCVPPDAHQQTAALVTGNHSAAAHTEPYLHKRPENT